MPANFSTGTTGEFSTGTMPGATTGHANPASLAPLAHMAAGQPEDSSFEDYERESGNYQPGEYENMQDRLEQGSDDES